MIKYKYTPLDFYNYIILMDLTISEQQAILVDFWNNHNAELSMPYRTDLFLLKKEVNHIKLSNNTIPGEFDDVAVIMNELNINCKVAPQKREYLFADYFKVLKLQLLYSDISYKKVKLKTVLSKLGYKKRTPQVKKDITNALKALEIMPYRSCYKSCKITSVPLETFIIFRLEENGKRGSSSYKRGSKQCR